MAEVSNASATLKPRPTAGAMLRSCASTAALVIVAWLLIWLVEFGPAFFLLRIAHRIPQWLDPRFAVYLGQACFLVILLTLLRLPRGSLRSSPEPGVGVRATIWFTTGSSLTSMLGTFILVTESASQNPSPFSNLLAMWAAEFSDTGLWGRFLAYALIVPLLEEFLFRALVLGILLRKVSRWLALAASVLLFASVHPNWLHAGLAGLVYGLLYLRYGHVWIAMLAHSMNNLVTAGLAPLPLAYLGEAGLLAPLGQTLPILTASGLVLAFACFVRFFQVLFPEGRRAAREWLTRCEDDDRDDRAVVR